MCMMNMLYWSMCSKICCDNFATPFLIWLSMVWVCDYIDFASKTVVMIFSTVCSMPNASPLILLYLVSALDRLLLAKPMGHNAVSSGASLCRMYIPSFNLTQPCL